MINDRTMRSIGVAMREEIDHAIECSRRSGWELLTRCTRYFLAVGRSRSLTDSTVLVTGETGTGKDLSVAPSHNRSHRSARSFVGVNVSPHSLAT